MNNSQYNIQFEKLCEMLTLGNIKNEPLQITGGLLHLMFKVKTDIGLYAVKVLNPQIMKRKTAMGNYILSEKVANIVSKNGMNALPAIIINDENIHNIDGQYYLVFPWIEGKSAAANEIDVNRAKKIGSLLAQIHNIDYSSLEHMDDNHGEITAVDWKTFLPEAKIQNVNWYSQYINIISKLYELEAVTNTAISRCSNKTTIGHRDLDQKNVLWNIENEPMIIDWECAGPVNPAQELIDVALYWSYAGTEGFHKDSFCSLVSSYINNGGSIEGNIEDLLYSALKGKTAWLEYSIKRSLGLDCSSDEERQLGTDEVLPTIELILDHLNAIQTITGWFK